jgi:hypothetical protein
MKDDLHGEYFANNDVVIVAVKKWLSKAGINFCERGMQALGVRKVMVGVST